ncbi:MAG: hypothetical protein R3F65_23610 [bacterium]
MDLTRACNLCGKVGLRHGNKSGRCQSCHNSLDPMLKPAEVTHKPFAEVIGDKLTALARRFGGHRMAAFLRVDEEVIAGLLAGQRLGFTLEPA